MTIKLLGLNHCVPSTVLTNADFEKTLDTTDEWIVKRTGIRERRVCRGETLFDLAFSAVNGALKDAGNPPVDAIFVSTASPDFYFPTLSCQLGTALGLNGPFCMDVGATCSGFVYILDIAAHYVNAGTVNTALVVSAEQLTSLMDYTDRSTCILFGDAAAAAVVTKGDAPYFSHLACAPDPDESLYAKIGGTMKMSGNGVYKFAVASMPDAVEAVLQKASLTVSDIDWFVFHQANSRIIASIVDRLGIDPAKAPVTIDLYANTSSASIPLTLSLMKADGRLKPSQKVLLAGFGAGYTYGTSIITV